MGLITPFLEGELLGDGSLFISRRYTKACFQLQAKSKQQVYLAYESMSELGSKPLSFIRKSSGYRRNPCEMWMWRSHRCELLTEQYYRWYINGKKTVPNDFVLSKESALHWYVGDGSLHPKQASIIFCTDNFDSNSVELLSHQLSGIGLQPYIRMCTNKYRIQISGSCVDQFLSWIGPCPCEDMTHKWSVVARKHSTKRVSDVEAAEIKQLRVSGLSYSEIAKSTSRSICCVYETINGRYK